MRDLREDSDLRQSDMADILGLTNQQAYQRYEAGRANANSPADQSRKAI